MAVWYEFCTVDVFTTTPYEGNPLAIIHIPKDRPMTQSQKDKIAKEFNLSETVFLHEDDGSEDGRRFDIFTILGEIPWAGHPTIGTICYIGEMEGKSNQPETFLLKAKAGTLKATFKQQDHFAEAEVPIKFHVHSQGVSSEEFLKSQPSLRNNLQNIPSSYPIASIVDGMNFILVQLATLEELSHVSRASTSINFALDNLDQGWKRGLLGAYFFVVLSEEEENSTTRVRSRMVDSEIGEDPATGSAASDLACYLMSKRAEPNLVQTYEIEQGVEMGRRSLIKVRVELNKSEVIHRVVLSGQAVKVQEGRILA